MPDSILISTGKLKPDALAGKVAVVTGAGSVDRLARKVQKDFGRAISLALFTDFFIGLRFQYRATSPLYLH